MTHIVIEGLPAVGKTEVLELLARFYPHRVRVLPELVKTLVQQQGIDLFRERARLSSAIRTALPARRQQIEDLLSFGYLCLEESHLGVHLAYSLALNDQGFVDLYASLADALPAPDAYIRMEIPISASLDRQWARGTRQFDMDGATLDTMLQALDRWHARQSAPLWRVSADRTPQEVVTELVDLLGLSGDLLPAAADSTFDTLLLLGRPASGKSEFIDYMLQIPSRQRAEEFFLGPVRVVDDFPILWDLFLQDDVWEAVGRGRLCSKRCGENYAVSDDSVWHYLMEQINRKALPMVQAPDSVRSMRTLIIEFSRGGPSGYLDALNRLSPEILRRAAALYVSVSFEESWRRNVARYDEKRRGGILTHSVPHEEMERSYGTDDWLRMTEATPNVLQIGDIIVPCATMNNEPESKDATVLATRYRSALAPLYSRWASQHS